LISISFHPSILNITSAIITSQEILHCTQYRGSNNTKGNDGKTEKTGKPAYPQQKNSTGTKGNEENKYLDPDSNKMKINYAKEPNEVHKNNLIEEMLQVINEYFIEMIMVWSTKMYRRHSRNSKTTKIENLKKQKKK
jgi:hypothetical protein